MEQLSYVIHNEKGMFYPRDPSGPRNEPWGFVPVDNDNHTYTIGTVELTNVLYKYSIF